MTAASPRTLTGRAIAMAATAMRHGGASLGGGAAGRRAEVVQVSDRAGRLSKHGLVHVQGDVESSGGRDTIAIQVWVGTVLPPCLPTSMSGSGLSISRGSRERTTGYLGTYGGTACSVQHNNNEVDSTAVLAEKQQVSRLTAMMTDGVSRRAGSSHR